MCASKKPCHKLCSQCDHLRCTIYLHSPLNSASSRNASVGCSDFHSNTGGEAAEWVLLIKSTSEHHQISLGVESPKCYLNWLNKNGTLEMTAEKVANFSKFTVLSLSASGCQFVSADWAAKLLVGETCFASGKRTPIQTASLAQDHEFASLVGAPPLSERNGSQSWNLPTTIALSLLRSWQLSAWLQGFLYLCKLDEMCAECGCEVPLMVCQNGCCMYNKFTCE